MNCLPASEGGRSEEIGAVKVTRSCPVCLTRLSSKPFLVREMMYGLRDEFAYAECASCGCVWLTDSPSDPQRYYPAAYYPAPAAVTEATSLKTVLWHERAKYCLLGSGLFGRLLANVYGRPSAGIFGNPDYYVWLKKVAATFSSKILDVGCGEGTLLARLHNDGFSSLIGVDPFIERSTAYGVGLQLLKQEIYSVDDDFDLIMFHHTFEHMPNPVKVLKHVARILRPDRYALLRIPVASSFAYRTYGANWAQLDAPRHLFLHTYESVRILAGQAGLKVAEVVCDSDEFQFWASEQYVRDIPLKDGRSYAVNPSKSVFTKDDIQAFKRKATGLNSRNEGDSACFYLYKPS